MSSFGKADFRELEEFKAKIDLLYEGKDEIMTMVAKELTARLLAQVIRRTPVDTGHLRRGWTMGDTENKRRVSVKKYVSELQINKEGGYYIIEIINPVSYAEYVEYGHETVNGGWVQGEHMLRISVDEIQRQAPEIITKMLQKQLKAVFK